MANGDPFLDEFARSTGPANPPSNLDPFLDEFGRMGMAPPAEGSARAQLLGQKEMGTERLGTGTRGLMSLGDTILEKRKIFNKRFPEGEVRRVPGTDQFVFRKDPSKPFSPIDPKEWSVREGFADIVEFLGEDAGPLIGETLLLLGTGGRSLPFQMMRAGVGAAGGELIEEAGEVATGVSEESPQAVGGRAAGAGAVGAAGVPVGRAIESAISPALGGGLARISPESREQSDAFLRLSQEKARQASGRPLGRPAPQPSVLANLPIVGSAKRARARALPTLGQVSDSPIARRLEGQSGSVGATLERFQREQARTITEVFDRLRNPQALEKTLNTMETVEGRLRNKALEGLRTSRERFTTAGPGLHTAVKEWDDQSRTLVNSLYERARRIEEPTFDITELQNTAAVSQFGVRGGGRKGGAVQVEGPEGRLQAVIETIQKLDPRLTPQTATVGGRAVTSTPVDQLRAIRSELFDLKTAPVVGPEGVPVTRTAAQAEAGRLFKVADDILFNPANASPQFTKAWRRAGTAARERFATNEKAVILEAAKTETPVSLARRLASPGQFDNLKTLRSTISNERFRQLQDAFKTDLLEGTADVNRRLDSFDPETLRMLISPVDEKAFRRYGKEIQRIDALDLKGIAERQGRTSAAMDQLARTATPAEVDTFVDSTRAMSGQDRLAFRAGLLDHLWRASTFRDEKNVLRVRGTALEAAMDNLKQKGLDRLIPETTQNVLKDIELTAAVVNGSTKEAGTSILAASVIGRAAREPLSGNIADPVFNLIQVLGYGRMMTSPLVRRLFVGIKNLEPSAAAAIGGAALGQLATDLERETASTGAVGEGSPQPTARP